MWVSWGDEQMEGGGGRAKESHSVVPPSTEQTNGSVGKIQGVTYEPQVEWAALGRLWRGLGPRARVAAVTPDPRPGVCRW